MGPASEELGSGLRKLPVGSYVIYYRPAEHGIEVARVLHAAQDVETQF